MKPWWRRYSESALVVLLAFAYLTRMYHLNIPEGYMFDEVYHAATAKLIAQNDPRAYEWWNPAPEPNTAVDWLHPPIAKYTQALSIWAFGENSFGWRFSSVVFGVLVIVVTYHLALQLTKNNSIALSAAALASLDGLLLVQSRIAMNDIHVTFFIVLTLLIYSKYRQSHQTNTLLLAGIVAGIAMGTKWSGLFGLVTLWFFECLSALHKLMKAKWKIRINWKLVGLHALALVILPIAFYVLSYVHMFTQGKGVTHFIDLHKQIWYYQTHLDETHPYQSRPWQWALDMRPVWYYVEYKDTLRGDIYAFGNPAIFWFGLVAVGYAVWQGGHHTLAVFKQTKRKKTITYLLESAQESPLFFLTTAYFLLWTPWFFSPRIMFFYHYAPAVPLLCIILAYWLMKLQHSAKSGYKTTMLIWILIIGAFIVWYPHWVGIPLSNQLKDELYFGVNSWK